MCETYLSGDRVIPDYGFCGGNDEGGDKGCGANLLNSEEKKNGYCPQCHRRAKGPQQQ